MTSGYLCVQTTACSPGTADFLPDLDMSLLGCNLVVLPASANPFSRILPGRPSPSDRDAPEDAGFGFEGSMDSCTVDEEGSGSSAPKDQNSSCHLDRLVVASAVAAAFWRSGVCRRSW